MTLYDILEVSTKASYEVIDKAYRVLVKKYHPDLQPAEKKAWAEDMIKKLNHAHEVLTDKNRRAAYDREIGLSSPAEPDSSKPKFDINDPKNKDIMVQSFINWFRNQEKN